eukprot:CAMPEP_0171814170 /NCGR_PEP_ID=MMETSP0991-20121206/79600_1 /TAXON_ID=483369 /ORGANISM="non described non described, Strain CCMP2098" /LENGTH=52 /DNA_ID=CAMNT_0012427789 /DNA_START=453 /DNA_END=609 /DNA_ORIENTATION=-
MTGLMREMPIHTMRSAMDVAINDRRMGKKSKGKKTTSDSSSGSGGGATWTTP